MSRASTVSVIVGEPWAATARATEANTIALSHGLSDRALPGTAEFIPLRKLGQEHITREGFSAPRLGWKAIRSRFVHSSLHRDNRKTQNQTTERCSSPIRTTIREVAAHSRFPEPPSPNRFLLPAQASGKRKGSR